MGSGLEPGPPPPPSDSTSPGPASNPTHPQLRSPFPPQAGAPRAGPSQGPPRLLWTPRLRPHSPCGFRTQAQGSCPPARPPEHSPENPRSSGGSAPGTRPLPAHTPRAALARPPPHLGVRATSPSGAPARGGASRVAFISGCPLRLPLAGLTAACPRKEILFLPDILRQIQAQELRFPFSDSPTGQTQANLPGSVNGVVDLCLASRGYREAQNSFTK